MKNQANFCNPDIFTDKETQAYRVNITSLNVTRVIFKKKKKTTTKTQCQNLNPNLLRTAESVLSPKPGEEGLVMYSSAWLLVDVTAGHPPLGAAISVTGLGKKGISRRTCSEEMSFSDLRRSQVPQSNLQKPCRVSRHWFVSGWNTSVLSKWRVCRGYWKVPGGGGVPGKREAVEEPNSPLSCPQVWTMTHTHHVTWGSCLKSRCPGRHSRNSYPHRSSGMTHRSNTCSEPMLENVPFGGSNFDLIFHLSLSLSPSPTPNPWDQRAHTFQLPESKVTPRGPSQNGGSQPMQSKTGGGGVFLL